MRWITTGIVVVAMVAWSVYPVSATLTRLEENPPQGTTLDGAAFLAQDEAAAVAWLREQQATRRVVIAEAVGGEYSQGARMSTFAGAVTVLGWPGHELQWRGPIPALAQREQDVGNLYRGDSSAIREVIGRYGIQFVVVGDFERRQYGQGVNARFEGVLPVAFRSGSVTIYRAISG